MTSTIEELREWSAGLMGYILHTQENKFQVYIVPGGLPDGRKGFDMREWRPDEDFNQLFTVVVPRMRELGWWLDLFTSDEGFKVVFFKEIGGGAAIEHEANDVDVGHAILLAAYATGEGR